jgi:uncharacterized protein (DUF488 family)
MSNGLPAIETALPGEPTQTSLVTFGYGARSLAEVLGLLSTHRIEYLVDVRSVPWSRYRPELSQDQLPSALGAQEVRYVFMGDVLGGRPDDPSCYDQDGRVDYRACEQLPAFRRGVKRLRDGWEAGHSMALMCSEGRPEDCHRTKLVAAALVDAGVDVKHIDERGQVLSQGEVLNRIRGSQIALIDDPDLLLKSRHSYRPAA